MEDDFKRIGDFEGEIKIFDARNRKDLAKLENDIDKIEQHWNFQSEENKSFARQIATVESNVVDLERNIYSQKEFTIKKFQ